MAVTTTAPREVDWITEGVGCMFPEAWNRLSTFAEDAGIGYQRGEGRLAEAYAQLLNSPDAQLRDAASRERTLWEDTHISIGIEFLFHNPSWDDDAYLIHGRGGHA